MGAKRCGPERFGRGESRGVRDAHPHPHRHRSRIPGPPELLPGCPDAVIDLQTKPASALVDGEWRYADARVEESSSSRSVTRTIHSARGWSRTAPTTSSPTPRPWTTTTPTGGCSSQPRRSFASARDGCASTGTASTVTIPERVGDFDPTGASVVFEVDIDDYAEVWVDGELPHTLGDSGGPVVGGFNAPNRVVLTETPGRGSGFRSRCSGSTGRSRPRRATTSGCARRPSTSTPPSGPEPGDGRRARDRPRRSGARRDRRAGRHLERVAAGFVFTEGPVWSGRGAAVQLAQYQRHLPMAPSGTRDGVPLQERLQRHRHRPLHPARIERAHLRPAGQADDLPARQPPRDPGRAARQHHRARRPLRRPAAEQPQRSRLPLRRHAVLHRPAVRPARGVRRPQQGAAVQRRVRRPRRPR